MRKKIKKLHDIWLKECDKKSCPIIEYLLNEKVEREYHCKNCISFEETEEIDTFGDPVCFCNNSISHRAIVSPTSAICETFEKK